MARTERDREPTPLRRARQARNRTLEDVVEQMDLHTRGGHSGVTPSVVSGWELGRHTTSIGHRKTLCDIYDLPADVLFAHQDESLGRKCFRRGRLSTAVTDRSRPAVRLPRRQSGSPRERRRSESYGTISICAIMPREECSRK